MQSDIPKKAKELISRYPEVFESLLEFEQTKKIPKLYHKQRLNITIDENILREFKAYAEKNSVNISRFIEQQMHQSIHSQKRIADERTGS